MTDRVKSAAILTAVGGLAVWSLVTYGVPRMVGEGAGRVGKSLAEMVGKRKR